MAAHGFPAWGVNYEIRERKWKFLPEIEEITEGKPHENFIEIFRQARPSSSIGRLIGKSFHFCFPYFVIFVLRYFRFHVVRDIKFLKSSSLIRRHDVWDINPSSRELNAPTGSDLNVIWGVDIHGFLAWGVKCVIMKTWNIIKSSHKWPKKLALK